MSNVRSLSQKRQNQSQRIQDERAAWLIENQRLCEALVEANHVKLLLFEEVQRLAAERDFLVKQLEAGQQKNI